MPARSDLLSLTADGLRQLANAGLVKRGQRDVADGTGPTLAEAADGTVTATFPDGMRTVLPPGRMPTEATCTCPASGMCRHRVTLVLAYQAWQAPIPPVQAQAGWDPAVLDAAGFEASLSAAPAAELARLRASGLAVRLTRGPVPTAHLPMATVRFLVPGEVGYARCDCMATTGCAHVALALHAFHTASGASEVTFTGRPATDPAGDLGGRVDAVLSRLLAEGAVAGMAAHAPVLDRARRAALASGATQLVLVLEQVEDQIAAYEQRSARYDEVLLLRAAVEAWVRVTAADAVAALGLGQPLDAAMAKARLVSLGGRIRAQGEDRVASVLLADPDTGSAMLLERRFTPAPGEAGVHARQFAPGLPVAGVAHGQILTHVARRRADGLLVLGQGGQGRTALMPRGALQDVPPPLLATAITPVLEAWTHRPISLLRPRNRVGDVHVFPVDSVLGQSWAPGAQLWQAAVSLPDGGGTVFLERWNDQGAPGALDVLSAAVDGAYGPIRQVTGLVRVDAGAVVCEPWSLSADRFVVPDLDTTGPNATEAAVPLADGRAGSALPGQAVQFLAGAIHAGLRNRAVALDSDGLALAGRAGAAGYPTLERRLRDWLAASAAPRTFARAAVWAITLLEA